MKRLTSLTQLFSAVLVISVLILNTGCHKDAPSPDSPSNSDRVDSASSGKIYLDLTKDQVIPGGITTVILYDYKNQGYTIQSLNADLFAHVQFKDSNGNIHYQDGWLKKGTKFLFKTKSNPRVLMMCGNDFWPEVD